MWGQPFRVSVYAGQTYLATPTGLSLWAGKKVKIETERFGQTLLRQSGGQPGQNASWTKSAWVSTRRQACGVEEKIRLLEEIKQLERSLHLMKSKLAAGHTEPVGPWFAGFPLL